ncbi:MAG: Chromosome partition protein Smc [Firmicutes bacterium ADurb.Bin193]|nr:MAG: Chromosome partition protein Smc [Firmicutes bacterium ADurb.Bin193]
MYLKSLEIQGFKSFAEKTNIEFGKGITAVVGPNGSGKSNIADAIRWVMGEQSAKSLRGGNMQDVIFSGTQKRKPLGFAEVTLYIDNSDKKLGIDYDEVAVTRRVFRSGESEYFINKSACRLKDIHELFMDTGVGRDGYSIIGQGRIDEIINSKPEDRRQIFEEAAGIAKYRYRKEEAERKLAHTQENITRVSDIITELETQLEPLRLQAEKAKKYLNLREQLKVLEVNVSLENIERFKKALNDAENILGDVESRAAQIRGDIENTQSEISKMFDDMRADDESAEQKRLQQEENSKTLAAFQSDIEVLKSRIEHNKESIKRIEGEIEEDKEKLWELDGTLYEKDGHLEQLLSKDKELDEKIGALAAEIEVLSKEESDLASIVEQIGADIIEKMNEAAQIRSKTGNYSALAQSFEARSKAIDKEISDKNDSLQALVEKVASLEKSEKDKAKMAEALEKKSKQAEKELSKANEEYARLRQEGQDLQIKLEQTLSRVKLLDDMEKSFDNYSRSVKAVMQSHESKDGELKGVSILGTVAQILKVPEQYTVAIETALGAAAQNIVTQTEQDAEAAIEFLKKTKAGRATFLPISAAKGGVLDEKGIESNKGYIGPASKLVTFDKKFEGIVTGLLGRVAVVDNAANAISLARKYGYRFRIVTLEGELFTPGGAISGGSRTGTAGLFSRANELATLSELAKRLKADCKAAAEKERVFEKKLAALREEAEKNADELRAVRLEGISVSAELKHSKEFLRSMDEAKAALLAEQKQVVEKADSLKGEMDRLAKTAESINSEIELLEKKQELYKDKMAELAQRKDEKSAAQLSLKMEKNGIEKDIQLHSERTELFKIRRGEVERSIEQKKQSIAEIISKNEDINDDIEFKTQQINELKEEIKTLKGEVSDLLAKRRKTEESIKQKQSSLSAKQEEQLKLQQEQGRLENRKTKAQTELENIINRLWEEYELTLSAAEEYRKDTGSITKSQKSINSLKEEIKSLGNINIDAIEEYANIKERFEFLTEQRNDLAQAQKNLEAVIADMVIIMKERFVEKFRIINENFNQVFAELFGGGRASLALTEPDDVLTSGVTIEVQPPGKALKSLLQLSGGEQALVSIAILFAILKACPSPFCILDEIEAALDDLNTYRFADYLKKFAKDSQFVVVTHRRGTMEAANILYGVTMQEQGVTSLLSLNIDDVEREAMLA